MDKKSLEEFQAVHSVKTIGSLNLSAILHQAPLKMVAAFSSISGRFGNAAQIDYSAANDFLNTWTRSLRNNRGVHAVSLNWSGWDETGMAVRNTFVKEHAERMGLHLIPPQDGAQAAILEMCADRGVTDIVLHRGLGDLQEAACSDIDTYHLPFIDRLNQSGTYPESSHRVFSVARDATIDQHRFHGVPLMPGVGYMEMMAEHLRLLDDTAGAIAFAEMTFSDAFKLYREESRELSLACRPAQQPREWTMQVSSWFKGNIAQADARKIYAEARVSIATDWEIPFALENWEIGDCTSVSLRDLYERTSQFPNNVVFGPLFSDMKRPDRIEADDVIRWNRTGCLYTCRFPVAQLTEERYPLQRFVVNPAFLDSMHQAGVIFSILLSDKIWLPVGAEKFVVVEPQKAPNSYTIYVNMQQRDDEQMLHDLIMLNEQGDVCCFVKNSRYRRVTQ
jgi:hypothetical protein